MRNHSEQVKPSVVGSRGENLINFSSAGRFTIRVTFRFVDDIRIDQMAELAMLSLS
jgi:hypothetical protein